MRGASFSRPDPYKVYDDPLPALRGNVDISGKTRVHPALVGGEATDVIVVFGQSTSANHDDGSYSASNSTKVQNFNLYDGGVYLAVNPLLGCSGRTGDPQTASWQVRLGDKRISGGKAARTIHVPLSIAGTKIADWEPGGFQNPKIGAVARRLAAVGLTPTMILQQIGESDGTAGTSRTAYRDSTLAVAQHWRDLGVSCPIFVAKGTTVSGTPNTNVRNACDDVVGTNGILAGPDFDTLNGTYRHDGTHWNATGSDQVATMWASTISAAGL